MKDHELLRSVCDDIYTMTGIKPVIYDANMRLVYGHPLAMGPFCEEIRKDPKVKEKCIACDRAGFDQSHKSGHICIYRCHMGLTEAVAPIVDRGTVIGYFLFGQMLEDSCRNLIRDRIKEIGGQNTKHLLELLAAMEPTDEQVIRASARLMLMCASYVQLQHVLNRQHKDLALSIADYISRNLSAQITIELLCKQFGISRGTLYTISKNTFGMGITEYLRSCRINTAVELLLGTNLPVCRIAETVGINDANYLTKLIKKQTGMTPKELRKQQ